MLPQSSLLVSLVQRVDQLPAPHISVPAQRGRPALYSDRLFLKAVVIMVVRRLHKVHELLSVLAQPTDPMPQLRALLMEQGRYPTRRTWERRLAALPELLPRQIGALGRLLVQLLNPWGCSGRAIALDSTVLRAHGGVWHQKDRKAGVVPHTSIDTEAGWTKSGWHGWVYGWKLHAAIAVGTAWIPLAATLTPAPEADSTQALALLTEVPWEARFVLGDRHYNTPEIAQECARHGRVLVATQYGAYPHTDAGVEVRRVFHKLRSVAMENFNEHFKAIFEGHGQVPTKGHVNTQRFALGAVVVYQLMLWQRFEQGLDLRVGCKAFLRAA